MLCYRSALCDQIQKTRQMAFYPSDSFRTTPLDSSAVAFPIKKDLNMGGVVTVKQPKSPLTYVTVPCLLYNSHLFFFLVFSYFIFSSFSQHCFNVCWCSDHQLDTRLERPSRCQSISAFQFFGVPLSTEDFCAVVQSAACT